MSEERKTKTDAAAPASAALERIDRKDAFLRIREQNGLLPLWISSTSNFITSFTAPKRAMLCWKLWQTVCWVTAGRPAILWAILETMTFSCACRTKRPSRLHGCRKAGCHLLYGNGRVPCAGKPRCRCRHPVQLRADRRCDDRQRLPAPL